MTTPSLWPTDIANASDIRAPFMILRAQAAELGRITHNVLEARVTPVKWPPDRIKLSFDLVARALDFYEYTLLEVVHGVPFYPLSVYFQPGAAQIEDIRSEEAFLEVLKGLFNSVQTKRIVQSLIAQSTGET